MSQRRLAERTSDPATTPSSQERPPTQAPRRTTPPLPSHPRPHVRPHPRVLPPPAVAKTSSPRPSTTTASVRKADHAVHHLLSRHPLARYRQHVPPPTAVETTPPSRHRPHPLLRRLHLPRPSPSGAATLSHHRPRSCRHRLRIDNSSNTADAWQHHEARRRIRHAASTPHPLPASTHHTRVQHLRHAARLRLGQGRVTHSIVLGHGSRTRTEIQQRKEQRSLSTNAFDWLSVLFHHSAPIFCSTS
ncbi:hypothetical protein F5148DRAFT_212107 [Russula earlei]|uniref:Uncharacterized protein n=1 Tax=Russula earlei TaxID=71964 RepID=A0ACC0U5Y8_9AGAM|nr:hypothetical protein F5148DRAFT_212107 [Russula earlei]